LAHISGGGLPGNLPRVLPNGTRAIVNTKSWQWPVLFKWLQQKGNVDTYEMYRTFNCGVGMVVVVAAADAETAIAQLTAAGETAWIMGQIEADAAATLDANDQVRVCLV
jgi:phosphoribosylformylglycinamidine cyclo-ligase